MEDKELFEVLHLPGGAQVLIDPQYYKEFADMTWNVSAQGYATAYVERKKIAMHDYIIGSHKSETLVVDHINGNKLDNRRMNLRLATRQQNNMNRIPNKTRKDSKYKGVVLHSSGRWNARIGIDKKKVSLGYFDNELDAANAYDKAALRLHGEYAYVNDVELRQLLADVRLKLAWVVTSSDDLLEKLLRDACSVDIEHHRSLFTACWYNEEATYWRAESKSPLKALLKLTLALHEAGELPS